MHQKVCLFPSFKFWTTGALWLHRDISKGNFTHIYHKKCFCTLSLWKNDLKILFKPTKKHIYYHHHQHIDTLIVSVALCILRWYFIAFINSAHKAVATEYHIQSIYAMLVYNWMSRCCNTNIIQGQKVYVLSFKTHDILYLNSSGQRVHHFYLSWI